MQISRINLILLLSSNKLNYKASILKFRSVHIGYWDDAFKIININTIKFRFQMLFLNLRIFKYMLKTATK